MMEIITKGPEETQEFGRLLGQLLGPGHVLIINGQMGAGKTTLVQGLARGMGIEDYITSPTFTIIHEHDGPLSLFHIDAYRLEDPEEGMELGLEEYFYGDGVTAVEWAERIAPWLPADYLEMDLVQLAEDPQTRRITLKDHGKGDYKGILEELKKNCKS